MERMKAKIRPIHVAQYRWVCKKCREDVVADRASDTPGLFRCGCRDRVWQQDSLLRLICIQCGPAGGLFENLDAVAVGLDGLDGPDDDLEPA